MDWAEALWAELAENETQPFSKERTISALRKAKADGYRESASEAAMLVRGLISKDGFIERQKNRASQIEKGN